MVLRVICRGGGDVLNKCLYGVALPRGSTPYPFIYHFSRKRYPFRILSRSINKWYPFHIAFLLPAVNALFLGINHINRTFSRLFFSPPPLKLSPAP